MTRRPTTRRVATLVTATLLLSALATVNAAVAADEQRVFELRTYTAAPGKMDALNARFREHTIELFKKQGMEVIGFWQPSGEEGANTLVYLMAYPSQEKRDAMWKAFMDDPEWKKVYAESHKDGPLVTKVESKMLGPTDYSPMK